MSSAVNSTQCVIYPTTIESWNQLGVENFIQNFPNAQSLSLEDFTFVNKVTNFICGLGENCLAGQQCSPFQGPLWFTLYALQEWNMYVNNLDEAVTSAVSQISSEMISDFLIRPDLHSEILTSISILVASLLAIAAASAFIGIFGPISFPAWGVPPAYDLQEVEPSVVISASKLAKRSVFEEEHNFSSLSYDSIIQSDKSLKQLLINLADSPEHKINQDERLKIIKAQGNEGGLAKMPDYLDRCREVLNFLAERSVWKTWISAVFSGDQNVFIKARADAIYTITHYAPQSEDFRLQKRSSPQSVPTDHFLTWTTINTYLTSFCDHLKAVISVTAHIGVTAPVGSDEGVWGILRSGKFMNPNLNMSKLQDKIREDLKLNALAQVLKSMNVFVTIGSDKCNKKGPNGAFPGKNKLSYCSPEGLMMNLVRASKKKTINEIVNANLINEKYGYSVEFLAQSAWSCQEKNLKVDGRTPPIGLQNYSKVGCTFDLPVCDTRIPEVAHLIHKKKTVAYACRKGLALNI
ncbi:hypothetical protein BY996DRAFT_4580846 [Phakopsora pachyrhizi]|nr:hypothetical protein BY996DRAFT_4580846 [Phakopsora pachyrhizi]